MIEKLVFNNLAELTAVHIHQTAEIFAASFLDAFSFISHNVDAVADAIEHSFLLEHFYVALLEDNVVGIAAFSTAKERAHRFRRDVLVSHWGLIRGSIAYFRLRDMLERPLNLKEHQCYIESVATDSAYRGMGISTQLQLHLLHTLPYSEFFLEVAETNFNAIRLFEKLGFSICQRDEQRSFLKPASQEGKVVMMCKKVEEEEM